jgi:Na+/H+-translocating membrane pyrophosphatase
MSSRIKLSIVIVSFVYAVCSALIVYVKDYTAGDQAIVPMFFSLMGLIVSVVSLLLVAFVNRLKKRKEIARELVQGAFWSLLIYIVVMVTMALASS